MADAFIELTLVDVTGNPVDDPNVQVGIRRSSDTRHILTAQGPAPMRVRLPDFTDKAALCCDITPSRYRHRPSDFFFLNEGGTEKQELPVARRPDQWNARFSRWNSLASSHEVLKTVLGKSGAVKLKKGKVFDSFADSAYDDVDEPNAILAKCALLNLYAKLNEGDEPWFPKVERVLEIGRERFMGVASPELADRARHIWENIGSFPDFMRSPAAPHYANIEFHIPPGRSVSKSEMFSIKSKEDEGNIQITLSPARKSGSSDVVWLIDSDIDENGRFVAHLYDALLKHKFTGGTHPFDIHECLIKKAHDAKESLDLGYQLV
jgi:hypothetical protein